MAKQVLYTRPSDGRLRRLQPNWSRKRADETDDQFLARIKAKEENTTGNDVGADWEVVEDPVFPDRHWGPAWTKSGSSIIVPIAKARALQKAIVRTQRESLWSHLDGVELRAMAQGDNAKLTEVRTEKQRLRDLPAQADSLNTLAELKALKAETSVT